MLTKRVSSIHFIGCSTGKKASEKALASDSLYAAPLWKRMAAPSGPRTTLRAARSSLFYCHVQLRRKNSFPEHRKKTATKRAKNGNAFEAPVLLSPVTLPETTRTQCSYRWREQLPDPALERGLLLAGP